MAHLLKIVLLGASVFMALTLVLDTCSSPSARDGSTSPCRRRHVGVLMHSRVGKDRSHLRNASRVFVFGILPSHYHDITLRVGPHQDFMALVSQDKRFEFVDVFTASKATMRRVLLNNSATVLLGAYLMARICAWSDDDRPPKHYENVDEQLKIDHATAESRILFLRRHLRASGALKASFVADVHPYTFGNQGLSHGARCFREMGFSVVLHPGAFGPEMFTIASVLDGMGWPMEIVAFPPFFVDPDVHRAASPAMHRDYDVLLCGAHLPGPYPFRHRLFQMVREDGNLSRIECSGGTAVGYRNGKTERLGPVYGAHFAALARRCKLAIVTCAGSSKYFVWKYIEFAIAETIMVGNLPMDALTVFTPDDMVHVVESMSDMQILTAMKFELRDGVRRLHASDLRKRVVASLNRSKLSQHVLDVLFPVVYSPFPAFLQRPAIASGPDSLNRLLNMLSYGVWQGTEQFYVDLATRRRSA